MRGKKIAIILCLCGLALTVTSCGKADNAYKKAMDYAKSGDYEKAANSFKIAIRNNKEKAEYYLDYGMTLNHLGNYKKAIKQFEKAYQKVDNKISRQNNKRVHYGEALAYYGLHKYEDAISQCKKALKISENKELNGDVYATMAMAQWVAGDSLGALGALDQLIKENSKDTAAYVMRGQIKQDMEEYNSAVQDFMKAIEIDEKCYEAYFGCFETYQTAGQKDAAIESLSKIISLQGADAEEKMQIGRAYICLDNYEEAEDFLQDAKKEKCVEASYYLGQIAQMQSFYDEAKEYYEEYLKSAKADVSLPTVYSNLAGCYIEQKDYDTALEYLEQGLDLGVTSAYQDLLRNQVILLEKMGKMEQAATAATDYINAYPKDEEMAKEAEFIATRIKKKKTTDSKANVSEEMSAESSAEPTTGSGDNTIAQ